MPVMEYRQAVFKAPAGVTEIAQVRRGETANKLNIFCMTGGTPTPVGTCERFTDQKWHSC